jgi:hypothetical protein
MNRAQRRAAAKKGKVVPKAPVYNMSQDAIDVIKNEAYDQGRMSAADGYTEGFMYCVALVIKVMHEKHGWGYLRLSRVVNQLLDEFNSNDMTWDELNEWLWNYAGFRLEKDDNEN